MAMRITIQVTCDSPEDAMEAMARLTRKHATWDEQIDSPKIKTAMMTGARQPSAERLDKIMGGSEPQAAEQSGDKDGVTGAPRPNISPGWVACQKIGAETKEELLKELPGRDNDAIHIGKKIKRNADATKALIQLLWDRDLIKWDGKEFYV